MNTDEGSYYASHGRTLLPPGLDCPFAIGRLLTNLLQEMLFGPLLPCVCSLGTWVGSAVPGEGRLQPLPRHSPEQPAGLRSTSPKQSRFSSVSAYQGGVQGEEGGVWLLSQPCC